MTVSTLLLTFGLLAPAQTAGDGALAVTARTNFADAGSDRADMYKHIEVMRQLLKRKLGHATSYPVTANVFLGGTQNSALNPVAPAADYFSPNTAQSFYGVRADGHTPVDGVYLPGYGVVFTASLPFPVGPVRTTTTKPVPKPASDWERIEKEIKGEKVDAAAPQQSPPSTGDIIVKLLAENGHHFSKLRDDERITIVVSFHAGAAGAYGTTSYPTLLGVATGLTETKPAQSSPFRPDPGATATAVTPPAQDYELLADMHLKQKRYDDALAAYRKAVARVEGEPQSDDAKRRLAALLLKQAQALAASEDTDGALTLLKRIAAIQAGGDPLKPATAPKAEPSKRVPSKLIISAPKRLLTEVGSGRMSIEEFRKGLQIEDLTPKAGAF